MNQKEFDEVLESRINNIRFVLQSKAKEYATDVNRLHNFKLAAKLESKPQTQEQALWGMLKKHIVSVIDMIDMTGDGISPELSLVNEKIGDCINYLILLEAMFVERKSITNSY